MRKRQNAHKSRSLKPGAACHSATVTLLRSWAARDRSEPSSHSRTHLDSCFHFLAQASPCSSPHRATLGDFLLPSGFISNYIRIYQASRLPTGPSRTLACSLHPSLRHTCLLVFLPSPHLYLEGVALVN